MIHLSDIRYFLAVAKEENVSRAASRIGISQPALSHALRRLESKLGKRLLVRTKTGVHLTRAGSRFAQSARDWAAQWEIIAKSVHEADADISGEYRLGCHAAVATYSLPRFLPKLLAEHPRLEIQLEHGLSREIVADILNWKCDFGLVINPPSHPELVIKELGKDDFTLWKSRRGAPADVLIYDPNLVQAQSILKALERKKTRFARKMICADLSVIHALTVSRCGVGILPERYATLNDTSELQRYSPEAPTYQDRLCLIYRAGAHSGAGAKAIIQAIAQAGI